MPVVTNQESQNSRVNGGSLDGFENVCKEARCPVCMCSVTRLELVDMENAHCTWARMARAEEHIVRSAENVHLGQEFSADKL